jgi:hypothetical protein
MSEKLTALDSFIKQYEEIEIMYKASTEEQGEIDRELSNWYHIVEGIDITHISQSHTLIKKGKVILEKRRKNKLEMLMLRSTCDSMRATFQSLKAKLENTQKKNIEVIQEIKDRAIL